MRCAVSLSVFGNNVTGRQSNRRRVELRYVTASRNRITVIFNHADFPLVLEYLSRNPNLENGNILVNRKDTLLVNYLNTK